MRIPIVINEYIQFYSKRKLSEDVDLSDKKSMILIFDKFTASDLSDFFNYFNCTQRISSEYRSDIIDIYGTDIISFYRGAVINPENYKTIIFTEKGLCPKVKFEICFIFYETQLFLKDLEKTHYLTANETKSCFKFNTISKTKKELCPLNISFSYGRPDFNRISEIDMFGLNAKLTKTLFEKLPILKK